MDELIKDIEKVQSMLERDRETWTKEEEEFYHDITIRLASHLPSPSKMNAFSVLKSNSAEKIAKCLIEWERRE